MSDKLIKSFSVNLGNLLSDCDYSAIFHADKIPPLGENSFSWPPKNDRKFNIRIKREDLCLLDAIANYHNITRSALINKLLHDVLLNELITIDDNAIDARAFIACLADKLAGHDNLTSPWLLEAVGEHLETVLDCILDYNTPYRGSDAEQTGVDGHSPIYKHVVALLQGVNK